MIILTLNNYLQKKKKIALGCLNTYIRNKGFKYDDTTWWDNSFYTEGVSDRQTISQKKSVITAQYHYASMELQILKHFKNNDIIVHSSKIKVIDIGSGSGHWIDFYKTLGVDSVTGIDVSRSAYEYLTQKYFNDPSVEIYQGKAVDVINNLSGNFDIVNAIGVMFHIVDDLEWENTIFAIAKILKDGGLFIIGGHFGFLDGVNVQIDKNGNINKRLRSRRHWVRILKHAGFTSTKFYRNNAYLWIKDSLPENNVLIAKK